MVERPPCDLKTLVELSTLIGSSLDIHTVLANAMTCAQLALNGEASAIFELDRLNGELFFRTAIGDSAEKAKAVRIKVGEGVAGWVAQTGKPLVVQDTAKDPRFEHSVDARTGFETRSILCVPMMHQGELSGVVEVLNKKDGRVFDQYDQEMLTVIANQVAIAIDNSKLYSRLNQKFTLTAEELKITQRKLIQSEKLAALGKLSQGVAHEVRNPVMVIGGFARRLKTRFAENDPVRKTLDIILAQTERLERMVSEFETFSKLRQPELRQLDIPPVVDAALGVCSKSMESLGIRVVRRFASELPVVKADAELLELALSKVVLNAVEAMPEGGILDFTLASQPDYLVISIKDSGIGIQPEMLASVFDPFSTSKTTGSGLGLTTVHRIISDHNGEVEISSVVSKGTEVRILLPVS
jgi:two-component system sensor histidine kinase HydH